MPTPGEPRLASRFGSRSHARAARRQGRRRRGRHRQARRHPDGNGETQVDVTPGAPATVAITLAANAIVIGVLVDPTGTPLAGQPVVLIPDRGDGQLQVRIDGPPPTTGPDGRFRLEHRAEPCALMVLRPPRPFSKRGLVLTAGQTLDLGTITVDAPPRPRP